MHAIELKEEFKTVKQLQEEAKPDTGSNHFTMWSPMWLAVVARLDHVGGAFHRENHLQ